PTSAQTTGSNVEVGGELGVDISNSLSFSILRVLTTTDSSVFNIRYRINDQFTLRAIADSDANNFSEGSGIILEFENRF
ncbi:MAG: translocation/assembly module TamB domain-containing protein, partial [Leptolyngbyaceae cyanobacterium MO_188.B28]|nr:translocation/assembly module TamB domain-containing protein [Leptolyngbyaceae cyanobacterium MO_188.B28]